MSVTDLQNLEKKLAQIDLDSPDRIVVSGTDSSIFDSVLEMVRQTLSHRIGKYESIVLTGEPLDDVKLREELFNIPLFSPYRLIVVRHSDLVLKPILSDKKKVEQFTEEMKNFPDRVLLMFQFEGTPPVKMLKMFGEKIIHYQGRELYSNQIPDIIRKTAKNIGLKMDEGAIFELKEKMPPRAFAIEQALLQLKDMIPDGRRHITEEDIRDSLFPSPGCNYFTLVDAIFEKHSAAFCREMSRFNPTVDNFFIPLKLMLNRTDEIRKAAVARYAGMNDFETTEFLGLKGRPPFIRNKILHRLSNEIQIYSGKRLSRIYNLLIQIQLDFRSKVPAGQQALFFSEKIEEVFFSMK